MKKLLIIFSLLIAFELNAQSPYTVKDTTFGGWLARVAYVPGYSGQSNVWIYMNGLSEVGTSTNYATLYGPFYWFNNGWDGSVSLGNGTHYPVYVYIQPPATYRTPTTVKPIVDAVKTRFNAAKTIVSGLSMGGWEWDVTCTYKANSSDYSYYSIANMIVSIEGMTPSGNTYGSMLPYPQRFGNMAKVGGVKYIGFEQIGDTRNEWVKTDNIVDTMGTGYSWFMWSKFDGGGHTGFNHFYDPSEQNWTSSNPNLQSTKPASAGVSNFLPGGRNIYQLAIQLAGDSTKDYIIGSGGGGGNVPPVANAGIDQTITLPTDNITANGTNSTDADGTISTYAWTKISGPAAYTITSPSASSTTITGLVEGTYVFRLTVTDNDGATSTDDITITVNAALTSFDYMTKNVNACGSGNKYTVGGSLISGKVTTVDIYFPYINRDNLFGAPVVGGDTIVIVANPNNGGAWNNVELGDFGGNLACPVVVMADSIVKINNNFRFGIRDSNVVAYTHVNGRANFATKGVAYGFQNADTNSVQDITNIGFTGNLVHHLEVDGLYVKNAEVGMMIKINGDSVNPYKQFPNFRLQNIYLHDIYLKNIHGEAMYIGNTDIDGTAQTANQGTKPPQGDTCKIEMVIENNIGWDGIQLSDFNYGNEITSNVIYKSGNRNQSSQQFPCFYGGNTSGTFHNNASYNSTGPFGILGKGICELYNNYIDSVNNGKTDADGIYNSMSTSGMPTPVDSLTVSVHDNVIGSTTRNAIFNANTSGAMLPGAIINNTSTKAGATFLSNVTGDNVSSNTSDPNYNLSTITTRSYRMLQLVRQYPDSLFSFDIFDVVNQPPVVNASYNLQNSVYQLTGSATDADGLIVSHTWQYLYGPSVPTIADATQYVTDVTGLIKGKYGFRFAATDDKGAVSIQDVEFSVVPITRSQLKQLILLPKQ